MIYLNALSTYWNEYGRYIRRKALLSHLTNLYFIYRSIEWQRFAFKWGKRKLVPLKKIKEPLHYCFINPSSMRIIGTMLWPCFVTPSPKLTWTLYPYTCFNTAGQNPRFSSFLFRMILTVNFITINTIQTENGQCKHAPRYVCVKYTNSYYIWQTYYTFKQYRADIAMRHYVEERNSKLYLVMRFNGEKQF